MTGASFTVRVNGWVASVEMPLLAVIVRGYEPPLPTAGVPLNVAVPSRLLTKVTPLGSVPVRVMPGTGNPLVVIVKLPTVPAEKVTLFALVIASGI